MDAKPMTVAIPPGVHGAFVLLLVEEDDILEAAPAPIPLPALAAKIAPSWDLTPRLVNAISTAVQSMVAIPIGNLTTHALNLAE